MHLVLRIESSSGHSEHDLGQWDRIAPCRIGRNDEADLVVHDLSVSRLHCQVSASSGRLVLTDLGSSSGTLLNGTPVSGEQALGDGDTITIGNAKIHVGLVAGAPAHQLAETVDSEAQTIMRAPWMGGATVGPGSGGPGGDTGNGSGGVPGGGPDGPAQTLISSSAGHAASVPTDLEIPLRGSSVTVGRDLECDIVLADQLVISRRHAVCEPDGRSWAIRDLGSSNGTFVNGSAIRRSTPLAVGDVISIGPFQLKFTGHSLLSEDSTHGPGVSIHGLHMPKREGGYILQDLSFDVAPGELVGLIGMSGSGKTRLMHAMCGRAAFSAGKVLYQGRDLVSQFDAIKSSVGYVPSKLMLHEPLKVREALFAISRLRLATDVKNDEINRNISETLEMLSIGHREDAPITTLSDGEKRRLGLAVELLAKPPVLLLDEVTTALDLPLHCRLMSLFRDLADRGQSLVLISHHIEDLELCDKWLYIVRGRTAFYGTPTEFCEHFGVASLREQLDQQESKTPEEWAEMYERSRGPAGAVPEGSDDGAPLPDETVRRARWGEIRRQVPLLMGRMVRLITADRTSIRLVALLAPLVAAVIVMLNLALGAAATDAQDAFDASFGDPVLWAEAVTTAQSQQSVVAYMLTVSAIVIASFLAVREIVKESSIYDHERFAGLEILPYLLGKLTVLGTIGIAATLAVTMTTTLFVGEAGMSARFVPLFLLLASLSVASSAMALLISAASKSSEQAVFVLIPVLIMQLALSGAFPLDASGLVQWAARIGIVNYWAYNGVLDLLKPVVIEPQMLPGFGEFKGEPYVLAIVMQWVHAAAYFLAAYIVLLRKDGPGFVSRFRREFRTLVPPPKLRPGTASAAAQAR